MVALYRVQNQADPDEDFYYGLDSNVSSHNRTHQTLTFILQLAKLRICPNKYKLRFNKFRIDCHIFEQIDLTDKDRALSPIDRFTLVLL